jgi:hypothetical protein
MKAAGLILLLAGLPQEQVDRELRNDVWTVPPDLLLRARVTALTPAEPTRIEWRHLGEGLGGTPVRGTLAEGLAVGAWSPPVAVASFVKGKFPAQLFLTLTAGRGGSRSAAASTGVELELEISWKGQVVKTFREAGPDGGTVGVVIPARALSGGRTPASPEFTRELTGLLEYAQRRADRMTSTPGGPLRRLGVVTNLGGYGAGSGYGIRHANPAIVEAELRTLGRLGVNGFAGAPDFLLGSGRFTRIQYAQLGGYPVPAAQKGKDVAEAGCPFAPGVAARTKAMIETGLETAFNMRVEEVWWRTEDEIGSVFDHAPEGKAHPSLCPRCAEAFRDGLKARGRTPRDLGASDWAEVRPADLSSKAPPATVAAYETAMFVNRASAGLFTPLRDALARANEETRAKGLKRPLVYSFALRGNTFLMGGHSLDFFDYYRAADNAFVYETSNRDPRIWGWDSYLCDVGRVLAADRRLKVGIYVKPHRGAPIQRALSAVARGAEMLYWYTYGPDYAKGDSFSSSDEALRTTARAASLLAKTEDVLVGATWAVAPEVAVVNPRSSELWARLGGGSPAAYENAKWIYTALAHAHVPVDPLDEGLLETAELSRYKVIYVSGAHLTRAAFAKLRAWVEAGGTLSTSGGGLARDEANQPIDPGLLGLEGRGPVELWTRVQAYGATKLETFDGPGGAEIAGPAGRFTPVVGREVLKPAAGTEVVARFADGGAALVRHAAGKGQVRVAGFFPGLEYSAGVRREAYDLSTDFDPVRRGFATAPALERTTPVVDASEPLVEGVLVRNAATGRRAVVLMNWAYRRASGVVAPVAFSGIKVAIRVGAEKATSTALAQPLVAERSGDLLTVTLPRLEEGDVLLLD